MKRISLEQAECPVARALDAIGDWWSLLIVRDAFAGARRFGEFQKGLGVSKGILATRLRDLVALGILDTAPASDGTAYQEYVLTKRGRDLFPIVVGLRQWGEDHCFEAGEAHSILVDNETGKRIERMQLRAKDGRVLTSNDTTVKKLPSPRASKRTARASRTPRSSRNP
ncbi:winged helix-turn-helix transcriptional regulator [Pendulispora albinea]|uniref:Helix-turn-helix transcriptional regulator n=1 Tax=Pendulispora albinea TaxID=2741071 RepID=A0ABZ2LSM6_9BACT